MQLTLEQSIWQKILVSFKGRDPSPTLIGALRRRAVGGITLFRHENIDSPEQVRRLTAGLQAAALAGGNPPLLIAADQEGGQLMAVGDGATPFPGNMALGAANSEDLARRNGAAIGLELRAMGINTDYAPVCDVNLNPGNSVVGIRSFGDDPALVGRMAAAFTQGLQSAGVAATAKHFPGHGDTAVDSHYAVPVITHEVELLRSVDLPPFHDAIHAGVKMVMTAHVALPGFNGGSHLPATLSPAVLKGLLRTELGFDGLIATDALDMLAIQQGAGLTIDAIAALAAGVDLLLFNHEPGEIASTYQGMLQAVERGLLPAEDVFASAQKVLALKDWLAFFEAPPLSVVGCADHRRLAFDTARAAQTLVHDRAARLPLRLSPATRLAAVMPIPADLTPADTSSTVTPTLARAIRRYHPQVEEVLIPLNPSTTDAAATIEQLSAYDLVIFGTINAGAHPGQAAIVNGLLQRSVPLITVALRIPYDLAAYPAAPTYICTYGILEPSMDALAMGLWGQTTFPGKLPVHLPG